jgi:hypothetical protein
MVRPKNHAGGAYSIPVMVKMNAEGLAVLDKLRGEIPRGTYLRGLLKQEAQRDRAANEMGR